VSRALDERLRALRDSYRSRLEAQLAALETSLRDALRTGSPQDCSELWTSAHNLAGTAGSYGFADLAKVVHEMEELVAPFRNLGDPPRPVTDGLVLLFEEAQRLARA